MSQPTKYSWLLPLIFLYMLLAVLPIALKLAAAPRFVAWTWWRATALFWAPWGMLGVLAALGFLLELVQRRFSRG